MTLTMGFLYSRIVGIFVGDKEGGLNVATVGILAVLEDFLVQFNVVVINGIIESDGNHHGYILGGQITGNSSTIFRTETVGQNANSRITWWGTVGIVVNV